MYERKGKEGRSIAGRPRPLGLQGASLRPHARAGRFKPHRVNHTGSFPGQTRLAFSRAAPNGGGGVSHFLLRRIREQSPGQVLPPDQIRPAPAQNRNRRLAAHFSGERERASSVVRRNNHAATASSIKSLAQPAPQGPEGTGTARRD